MLTQIPPHTHPHARARARAQVVVSNTSAPQYQATGLLGGVDYYFYVYAYSPPSSFTYSGRPQLDGPVTGPLRFRTQPVVPMPAS